MKAKFLVLALAPAMLIAAPLRADNATSAPQSPADRRQEMLKQYDADGDGRLSEQERAAARAAMKERRGEPSEGAFRERYLQRYDADGDGKLSDAEKAKAEADWKTFVAKHDKDGDGKLSPDEARAARQAWAKEHPEAARRMRAAADDDGDGRVSPRERREARQELRERRNGGGN